MVDKIRYYLILIFLALVWLSGYVHGREIIDMAGRKVTVPDIIRKVYSVSPPATSMVYAVAPELIAGLNYAPRRQDLKYMSDIVQNIPVIGGWFGQGQTPNLETLMQVYPDIILVWQWQGSASIEKIQQTLEPLGFPILHLRVNTLDDYPEGFEFLGKLLGYEPRTTLLAKYARETLEDMKKLESSLTATERVSVYYAQGMTGLNTDCSASLHAELIPLCGGKNVHVCGQKDVFGMEKISLEQVIRYNPQVILAREPYFHDRIYGDPRWQNIRAVQEHRVLLIPRSPLDWFDRPPSFMRLLGGRWLMNRLYPDKYPIDMIKETRDFYRLFLKISLDHKQVMEILNP